MATLFFDVILNRKKIDSVSQLFGARISKIDAEAYVKESLINHDGYDPAINVRLTSPLTCVEYLIQTTLDGGKTWDDDTTETSWKDVKLQLKTYRENGCMAQIVKRRVSVFQS